MSPPFSGGESVCVCVCVFVCVERAEASFSVLSYAPRSHFQNILQMGGGATHTHKQPDPITGPKMQVPQKHGEVTQD